MSIGCDGAKDMQVQALQDRINQLEQERGDLQTRLAAALGDANDARARAADLQQQLEEARALLAQRPSGAELPENWQGTRDVAWTEVADDLLFDSGKANLKQSATAVMERIVSQMNENFPGWDVWVIGHTDSDPIRVTKGIWQDNLDLSVNRAMAVARELYKNGIARDRLIAGGQGEYNPKVANDSKEHKALNRRVEIVVFRRPMAPGAEGETGS